MPPRTRTTKTTKGLKENAGVVQTNKQKTVTKNAKPVRKVLADKTNSASDDNASSEMPNKVANKPPVSKIIESQTNVENRPRRGKRLPKRFADNEMLLNLSSSKGNATTPTKTTTKVGEPPIKTPQPAETSLLASRPRRVYRLPAKLADHSISPSKFIPVHPCHASTPIVQRKPHNDRRNKIESDNKSPKPLKDAKKMDITKERNKKTTEPNNNIERRIPLRNRKAVQKTGSSPTKVNTVVAKKSGVKKVPSPGKNAQTPTKKVPALNKSDYTPVKKLPSPRKKCPRAAKKSPVNFSFRMLEDRQPQEQNEDVYEFTYDPKEEPAPQKKKKRVVAKKKKPKPKTVTFTNNYDRNLSQTLTALKTAVSKTPNETKPQTVQKTPGIHQSAASIELQSTATAKQLNKPVQQKITAFTVQKKEKTRQKKDSEMVPANATEPLSNQQNPNPMRPPLTVDNNLSIPIEDIAADLEATPHHEINYSPPHSSRPQQANTGTTAQASANLSTNSNLRDPLNLREELSFFDDQPVASSSMNVSVRHPEASPWRVEFDRLPIKWQVNSYVKPNMTPAVECSFINFDDGRKKHVYTNLVPENNDVLPEIVQNEQPGLVQTSIISFYKEVAENSAKKKKRDRSRTPVPNSAIFDDIPSNMNKTAKTLATPRRSVDRKSVTPKKVSENLSNNSSNDKETSRNRQKRKNESHENAVPAKTPRKEKESSKENSYFGFDDSQYEDQENIAMSPKKNQDLRTLRSKARAVLKEINEQGPTRAVIPVSAKAKANMDIVNQLYDEMKSAKEAPDITEKNTANNEVTTVTETSDKVADEDSQSVHLFEDVELVHHFKPQRKSYGKAKKVAFRQVSSDSDSQIEAQKEDGGSSSEEDDMLDLTFEMPAEERKKKKSGKKKMTKKQKLNKKEQAEAEAWAAGFNSMCEDVEEFPLVVE